MDWIHNLFFQEGIAHSILILAITIALGIILGKIKIGGISLGITWILFVGIAASHFGFRLDAGTLHFVKEFGLILFVYSIGLQVGPGFFASFRKGGITLNMLAVGIVFLGVITAYVIHVVTGTDMTTMVGILSGAVTNTPGLGAAQQTYLDATGTNDPTIALGYAVAYPLGVIGIILAMLIIRYMFRIKFEKEDAILNYEDPSTSTTVKYVTIKVENPALFGKNVEEITRLINKVFVISRIYHENGSLEVASSTSVLYQDDKLLLVTPQKNIDVIAAFIGKEIEMSHSVWEQLDNQHIISRRILITRSQLNGKPLGDLRIRNTFGVNITRVSRAGVDLIANPSLKLQMGDKVTVVGHEAAINEVAKALGNSMRRLREPNLIPIFIGIFLGVLLGSIPFMIPGIPQPIKLGLAGGPLIVSILISRYGPQYKLVTYTTLSANMMLREIGISLFLAAVGLGAGEGFIETIVYDGGYRWIGYGFIITIVPLLIVGIIARAFYKINYYTLMGLIAGSTTDPPALAYANGTVGNDLPSVSYATVYPLTMFLRVLTAQLLILLAL